MLKAEGAFGSIVLLSNTSVVMVSSGQCSEIIFLISNNDANWNYTFGICLGCIWNHFGVTRALKYVPSTCDVIIVVLVSSGHIYTNHAWINPTLWFISILISFLFCSIVIRGWRVGFFNFGSDRVRVLEKIIGSGRVWVRVRVLVSYIESIGYYRVLKFLIGYYPILSYSTLWVLG